MMIPMYLPYYNQPEWEIPLVGLTIHAFGVLVAIALVVGTWVARWHGTKRGQNPTAVVDAATWTCISGFLVAHVVSVVFYFPERLAEDPLQIIYIWNGLSSFGGFFGAMVGAYVYLKRRGLPIMEYMDTMAVGLAPGWVLGRLGCTVAHDHPGLPTDFFLAFDHPQRGPIHDLGFYEFLFAACITVIVMILRTRKVPVGTIPAVMCIVYAPVRFMFDFLRIQDAKYSPLMVFMDAPEGDARDALPWWYLNFTPGQWFAVALFVLGFALLIYSWRAEKKRSARPRAASAEGEDGPRDKGEGDESPSLPPTQ